MEDINTTQNPEQQPDTTPTPEASGEQGEKLFTQADLDRIIGERLARSRAKAEPSPADERETQLKARESRLDCRDYLEELSKGEYVKSSVTKLLNILDTSDAGKFKETVGKLLEIGAFERNPQLEPLVIHGVDRQSWNFDHIAEAFKPK